jgi:hypothetical protein
MKLEKIDREILRLTALLKDYPTGSFFASEAAELADCGYLRRARNGLTYRLTEKGVALVEGNFPKDKFPLGAGKILERRIKCAKVVLTMYRAGIDIFKGAGAYFFPAVYLRGVVADYTIGASRLVGLLITPTKTFLTYFAGSPLHIEPELRAAKWIASLTNAPENWAALIMCERWRDVFCEEYRRFPLPVHAATCDDAGARELKMLITDGALERLLGKIFTNYDERHNLGGVPCDAIKDGVAWLYAYDVNVQRICALQDYALEHGQKAGFVSWKGADYLCEESDLIGAYSHKEEFLWETFGVSPDLCPLEEKADVE